MYFLQILLYTTTVGKFEDKVTSFYPLLPTFSRFFTNNYLREEAPNSHVVEQRVEWQVFSSFLGDSLSDNVTKAATDINAMCLS